MDNNTEVARLVDLYGNNTIKDKLEIAVSKRFSSFNQILIVDRDEVLVIPIAAGFSPGVYGKLISDKKNSAYADFFLIENEVSRHINPEDAEHLLNLNPAKEMAELIHLNLDGKSTSFGDLDSPKSMQQWYLNFKRSGNSLMKNAIARNL